MYDYLDDRQTKRLKELVPYEVLAPDADEIIEELERLNNIIKELSKDVDMWNKKYNEQFNIITELEKWLEDKQDLTCGCGITVDYLFAYENCLDKLKALKENNNE